MSTKTKNIGLRATDSEAARIQRIADVFTNGDKSLLIRKLIDAADTAIKQHGARHVVQPFELNYFPRDAKTAQDIINAEKDL